MAEAQETMKAIQYDDYGDSSVFQYKDVPKPAVGDEDVLIEVKAAGMNPVDWKLRAGYIKAWPQQLPIIPGWDAAGVVAAVGANVERLKVGDEVYAYTRPAFDNDEYKETERPIGAYGSYAQFVSLNQFKVALKPQNISFSEAAGVPLAALTAYEGLFEKGGAKAGDKVVVINASGGVGSFAIQFLKAKGCEGLGICSSRNTEYVSGLGATHTVDYSAGDQEAAVLEIFPGGADIVFDAFGGDSTASGCRMLKEGGTIVSIANFGVADVAAAAGKNQTGKAFLVGVRRDLLEEITALIEGGDVRVGQVEEMPLAEAAEASIKIESHRTRGKIVLLP